MNALETQQNYFEIRTHTGEIWEQIYQDCLVAQASIDFEQYILRNDHNGQRFIELFIAKAEGGIQVRLLLDRVGCRTLYRSPLIKKLRAAGGKVYFYNPINWLNLPFPGTWFPRNHIKMVKVDSRIAWVGGACFADYMRDWRDLQFRISGNMAQSIPFGWEQFSKVGQMEEQQDFHYVIATPNSKPIYAELRQKILNAKHEILLATPYFIPPWRLESALQSAVARGVSVKIIMSVKTDVPMAVRVAQSYFPRLIRKGLQIYVFESEVFHAKYMVVDGKWATLGSTNIDYLSLFRNREANLVMTDQKLVGMVRQNFDRDLQECEKITKDFWYNMPWHKRCFGFCMRAIKTIL